MRIATRGLFAILRRHVCQELQVRPEEVEKKLEDLILIGTNCVTNCNSILAHQGPWLSNAAAFNQLNQPIRFDLYQESTSTSNQTIHQDMDGCESVGSTNVEDLLARKRETETRLVQTSDLDLTWDVPMASHWTSSCNEKNKANPGGCDKTGWAAVSWFLLTFHST
jgi:hypothetical protein